MIDIVHPIEKVREYNRQKEKERLEEEEKESLKAKEEGKSFKPGKEIPVNGTELYARQNLIGELDGRYIIIERPNKTIPYNLSVRTYESKRDPMNPKYRTYTTSTTHHLVVKMINHMPLSIEMDI